ncbi:GerAB/ArcD/ProY family transporter [Bacillus norwichensis]|uniref:Endospore germination permease n=1 Tax=Bacillus norwichensis TaxID=2762217 RepID=A0ABR8VQU5_9BACI|nr:endospore germination permease [Bacillus norwichensis]MBD8006926.1 endospore germination permease [Bacillus norwichensis]
MEKGKISALQMLMLIYPTIIATGILSVPAIVAQFAGNDSWFPPIIASSAGFLAVFIADRLHKLYPGKTLIQYSEDILGRIMGKLVSFLVLFFYIEITGSISRLYSEFIVTSFLFTTPQIVVIASMLFLCAICVYGGLEVLLRTAQLLFPFFVLPIALFILFSASDFQFGNILPIFENGIIPSLKGAVPPSGWFAEFFIISFFLPFLSSKEKGLKYGMLSVLIVMITLVIVNLIVTFVLGYATASKIYPLMNVGRYTVFASFFENMEAVVMTVWIAGAFVKISAFYYVAVLGLAQWLKLSDYRPVVWPMGILMVQFAYWGLPNTVVIQHYEVAGFPIYSVSIQILIPFILLVIAFLRKKGLKEQSSKKGVQST